MDQIIDLPPKFTYTLFDLGQHKFQIDDNQCNRLDFELTTKRNINIHGSIYYQGHLHKMPTCIIYLHCNCGSRLQAQQLIEPSLKGGYGLMCFDFGGCGHSSGQYISLGYHEANDLKCIIKYLQSITNYDIQIILWGRSMGAVTAVRFLSIYPIYNIRVAVLDSPFSSLKELIIDLVNQKMGVPKVIINLFLKYIEPIIQNKAKFKLDDLNLIHYIRTIKCPLIFVGSKTDNLVPFYQIQKLYDHHTAKKTIYYLQQAHNEPRTNQTVKDIFQSIWKYLIDRQPRKTISKPKLSLTINNTNPLQTCLSHQLKCILTNNSKPLLKTFLNNDID